MKRVYRTFTLLGALILCIGSLYAYNPPAGGDNADIFRSPALLGGGTSVAGSMLGTSMPGERLLNPALGSAEQRIILDASWMGLFGTGDESGLGHAVNLGLLVPTRWSVLSGSVGFLTSPFNALPLGTKGSIHLAVSKDLTDNLYLGAGLTGSAGANWGVVGDIGILYKIGSAGFLEDIRVGAALNGLGRPFTPNTAGIMGGAASGYPSMLTPQIGTAATLLSEKAVRVGASIDISAPTFQNLVLDAGLEAKILDLISFRTGWNFNLRESLQNKATLMPSFGLGVNLNLNRPEGDSFLARNGWNQSEITPQAAYKSLQNGITAAGLGVNMHLGVTDTHAPAISVDYPAPVYTSPNNDGNQDALTFPIQITDQRYVLAWSFIIKNTDGEIVRTIANKELRPEMQDLKSFWNLLTRVKAGIPLPDSLRWDGILDSGETAADGEYIFYITATDDNDNVGVSERFTVFVDNTAPVIDIAPPTGANAMIFSPDGDGNKDTFPITQSGSMEDLWTGRITDASGTVVRTIETHSATPAQFAWDGKNDTVQIVPDGVYTYTIFARDRAGNSTETHISNIIVDTDKPSINIGIDINAFSPNGDGVRDIIRLNPSMPVITGLVNWEIRIQNRAGVTIRSFNGESRPVGFDFNGTDANDRVLTEGEYQAVFSALYSNGHSPITRSPFFLLDITAPNAQVRASGDIFSPVGDGKLDTVTFSQQMSQEQEWTGSVYTLDHRGQPVGSAIRSFILGSSPPARLVWDGRDDSGKLASDGRYGYRLSATDRAGNTGHSNLSIVELNTEKADLILQANLSAFSPNGDNVRDTIIFTPILKATTAVERYTLTISDTKDIPIRIISGTGRVPASFTWNGIGDPAPGNATGTRVADGIYRATLEVTLVNQQSSRSTCPDFEIDTRFPTIELSAPWLVFSPNDDRQRDTLPITQKSSIEDRWTGTFLNFRNAVVRTVTWNGDAKDVAWDATDDSGNRIPDGTYSYIITSEDRAGNRTRQQLTGIVVDARVPKAFITAEQSAFSPNNDGIRDTQRISITTNIPEGLLEWSVAIKPENSTPGTAGAVRIWNSGAGTALPATINWDGMNAQGTTVQGRFFAELNLIYTKGDQVRVVTAPFLVNTQAPSISVRLSPRYFSPDNDGIDDELNINLRTESVAPVSEWSFEIREPQGTAGNIFWRTGGDGTITERIVWDGRSQRGELVQAATDYPFTFTVRDEVGLTTVVRGFIPVDVLVIRDGDRLKIAVPSIIFRENAADFNGLTSEVVDRNILVLRRIAEILNKFRDYRIQVEGHANNVTGTQREEDTELIPLSRSRADAVRTFLIQNGVDAARLTTIGMGGTRPVATRGDRENWWKNRRVEFILIR